MAGLLKEETSYVPFGVLAQQTEPQIVCVVGKHWMGGVSSKLNMYTSFWSHLTFLIARTCKRCSNYNALLTFEQYVINM